MDMTLIDYTLLLNYIFRVKGIPDLDMLQIFQINPNDGLETSLEKMAKVFIESGKNIMRALRTTFELIVPQLIIYLVGIIAILILCLAYLMDNIQSCYGYIFQKDLGQKQWSPLIRYYRLLRIGIKKLKKRWFGLTFHLG